MTDRVKSNSGVGLDILANPSKTRKASGNGFSSNQNIKLDSNGDNDSYTFKVDEHVEVGGSTIDDSGIGNLEKLNSYHDTFSSPRKSSPLFKARTESKGSDRYDHEIKEKVINDNQHGHDHGGYNESGRGNERSFSVHKEGNDYNRHDNFNSGSNGFDDPSDSGYGGHASGGYGADNERHAKYSESHRPEMTEREIRIAKREVYRNLQKLKDKGVRIPHFTDESDLDEMKDFYEDTSKDLRRRAGVRTLRKAITTGSSIVEFVFGKWNPLSLELEGWSESVNENITDFDDVFEEFAEKYFKDRSKLPVEIRLVGLILWSALSFHFTQQMAKRMTNGGKFMGMSMEDMGNMFGPARAQTQPQGGGGGGGAPVQETMRRPNAGGFSQASSQNVPRSGGERRPVREMRPAQGVDDIVNELREEFGDDDGFSVTSEASRGMKERSKHRNAY